MTDDLEVEGPFDLRVRTAAPNHLTVSLVNTKGRVATHFTLSADKAEALAHALCAVAHDSRGA